MNNLNLINAQKEYTLNTEYQVTQNLLLYLKDRIIANKKEIEELIKIKKEEINFNDILEIFNKACTCDIKYKNYKNMKINEKFINTKMLVPFGIVAVEEKETLEVVKYFISAIISRNGILIIDKNYDETSVKNLILLIISEALQKFTINSNIIALCEDTKIPYEQFDKVINKKEMQILEKMYIYINSKELKKEALKFIPSNTEIIEGEIEEVIEKINLEIPKAATIYTTNKENAYKFINLIKSPNVFVNASLENVEEQEKTDEILYYYKNIILPMPQLEKDNKETALVLKKEGIIEKIKKWLDTFLKK